MGVVVPDVGSRGDPGSLNDRRSLGRLYRNGVGFAKTLSCLRAEYSGECVLGSTAGKAVSYGAKPPSPNVAICHIKSFNNN